MAARPQFFYVPSALASSAYDGDRGDANRVVSIRRGSALEVKYLASQDSPQLIGIARYSDMIARLIDSGRDKRLAIADVVDAYGLSERLREALGMHLIKLGVI